MITAIICGVNYYFIKDEDLYGFACFTAILDGIIIYAFLATLIL